MLHACVERFDVTGAVGKFLGTKRGPILPTLVVLGIVLWDGIHMNEAPN